MTTGSATIPPPWRNKTFVVLAPIAERVVALCPRKGDQMRMQAAAMLMWLAAAPAERLRFETYARQIEKGFPFPDLTPNSTQEITP